MLKFLVPEGSQIENLCLIGSPNSLVYCPAHLLETSKIYSPITADLILSSGLKSQSFTNNKNIVEENKIFIIE